MLLGHARPPRTKLLHHHRRTAHMKEGSSATSHSTFFLMFMYKSVHMQRRKTYANIGVRLHVIHGVAAVRRHPASNAAGKITGVSSSSDYLLLSTLL